MTKPYNQSFKLNAVKQILEQGKKVNAVAQELNLSPQTLYKWVQIYQTDGEFIGSGHSKDKAKKYIRRLEIENQILKRSLYIKKDTESIFEFIHTHKDQFAVATMCRLLGVTSSAYYNWAKDITSKEERRHNYLKRHIRDVYLQEGPDIGSPYITDALQRQGISTSQATVARIIKENKEIWHTNYTAFHDDKDVVLHFPNKDTVWNIENGQFYHQQLAKEEIQDMLSPGDWTNMKKYNPRGTFKVDEFKNTDDLLIQSDNLLALHTLKSRFKNKVKLIYIDPPYNSKRYDLCFPDYYSHATYLTFLKNRLEVARNMLRSDGSIFIHCNDKEQAYIKVLVDEIFGRENFINQVVWKRRDGQQNRGKIANTKDYILIFARNKKYFQLNKMPLSPSQQKEYKYEDENGVFRLDKLMDKNGYYSYTIPSSTGAILNKKWIYPKETLQQFLNNNEIYWSQRGIPYRKSYLNDHPGRIPGDLWETASGTNSQAVQELKTIIGENHFTYPKPETLLKNIIAISTEKGDIVLDFFAGSGTTAAVAHKMKRQYIAVEQMDEACQIAIKRLNHVIHAEQGGTSKNVEWKGGDSFVFAEITKHKDKS